MTPNSPSIVLFILVAAWLILGIAAATHAISFKRDPRGAVIWVFLALILPLIGPWLYWVLGINRIERRALERLGGREKPFHVPNHVAEGLSTPTDYSTIGHLTPLRDIADRVTRLPLLPGNALTPLHNGEQAYPAMLEAIKQARQTLTLASYIFDWDEVGREFAHALSDAAGRGVRVHILLDGVGAVRTFSRMGRFLLQSGARVAAFFPLRFPLGRLRINLRNHRKLLVADGKIGFTGGMNISERHLVDRSSPRRVEDLHFRVTGPVVAELQQAFCEDWYLATDELLTGDAYFPRLDDDGPSVCRGIISGPDENFEQIHWILQGAFASAQETVRIVTPYFVPSAALISAIVMSALRGVEVTLILPAIVDRPYMRWAADAYLWQLLERGVRVFRRSTHFVHTKLLIVDERWILFGSANMDRRSFRLNFEFNVDAYDTALAARLSTWVDSLLGDAEPVSLASVDSRPTLHRLRDGFAKLFSAYL